VVDQRRGRRAELATIEWYQKNHNGKLPLNDTLLAATIPGAVDAWYILLSRWGTKSFAEVLAPALEIAEGGIALTASQAAEISSRGLSKYQPAGRLSTGRKALREGDIFRNPQLARTLRRLIEAEREALGTAGSRTQSGAGSLLQRDIAREMARFCEENGGLMRYEDFAGYTAKVEETVSYNFGGIWSTRILRRARSGGAVRAQHPPRLRSQGNGP